MYVGLSKKQHLNIVKEINMARRKYRDSMYNADPGLDGSEEVTSEAGDNRVESPVEDVKPDFGLWCKKCGKTKDRNSFKEYEALFGKE
jgi:hypothetical protein